MGKAWHEITTIYSEEKEYSKYFKRYDEMLEATNKANAPWHVVSGEDLQAGMLTFVTSASGIVVLGINAAFWGILVGIVAVQVTRLVHHWNGAARG